MPRTIAGLPSARTESVTVGATSTGLTRANYDRVSPPVGAVITVETAQIRWWDDGTDPTASEGYLSNVGAVITLDSPARAAGFRAIRTGGTSATLRVAYRGT